jgi:hypothetical protein
MNTHLTDEQRLAYLEGRASTETAAHLDQCPTCAAEIQSWRRTIQRLEDLEWPARVPRRATTYSPMLKWAMAASMVLCVGFGLGRFSGPDAAEIQAAVKADLVRDLETKLAAAFEQKAGAQPDLTPILAALTDLRAQQNANYISLRKDLETLASTADARIQLTSRRLTELASNTQFTRDQIQ